jgi:hypothetical protein
MAHQHSETFTSEVELEPSWHDPLTGGLVAMGIVVPGGRWFLGGPSSPKLVNFIEGLGRHKDVRDVCGMPYIGECLRDWIKKSKNDQETRSFGDLFLERLRQDVTSRSVLVPIEGIALDRPFQLGASECDYFTEGYFATALPTVNEGGKPGDVPLKKMLHEKLQAYWGSPFLRSRWKAEITHAIHLAETEAEEALTLLRFFHPSALEARAHCPIARWGRMRAGRSDAFVERDGKLEQIASRIEPGQARVWDLSGPELDHVMGPVGLGEVHRILRDPSPSELESKVLAAIALFSNGLVLSSIEHRLLHALVALESLLLKDSNEPILGALGLRLAHRIGDSQAERREIVETLRGAYGLRSGFVHHGRSTAEASIDLVNRAIRHAWVFLVSLLKEPRVRERHLSTKDQLVRELDDRALA